MIQQQIFTARYSYGPQWTNGSQRWVGQTTSNLDRTWTDHRHSPSFFSYFICCTVSKLGRPDTSVVLPNCPRHFGNKQYVFHMLHFYYPDTHFYYLDTSVVFLCCRSVLLPKCLTAEGSVHPPVMVCITNRVVRHTRSFFELYVDVHSCGDLWSCVNRAIYRVSYPILEFG